MRAGQDSTAHSWRKHSPRCLQENPGKHWRSWTKAWWHSSQDHGGQVSRINIIQSKDTPKTYANVIQSTTNNSNQKTIVVIRAQFRQQCGTLRQKTSKKLITKEACNEVKACPQRNDNISSYKTGGIWCITYMEGRSAGLYIHTCVCVHDNDHTI